MDKLEKPIKGKNLITIIEAFFKKVIKKLNQVHSQEYIESELADNIGASAKYIRINNGQHIETFLKQLINEGIGDANSYVGLKVEVVKNDKVYSGVVEIVQINNTNIILRPKEAFGEFIQMPAIVRLYVAPLFISNSESSIVYNSIVTSKSKYNFILGERNIHKGEDNVWIFGKNNVSRESNHNSLIDGYNNDVDSYGNLVIGDNNKHRSYYGATIGQKIKNFKKYSYLFGEGHDNGNGSQYGTAFGKYSKIEADTLFAIGDGTNESNRHNLFELKRGGAILDKDGNDIRKSSGSQVQSDWNETDSSKPAYIKNKPTIPTPVAQQQSDWNENDSSKPSFIKNKPTIPDTQVQADWNETDSTKKSFIKNKPNINSPITKITWAVLKDLKDHRDLIPGMQYRITDYQCTTTQPNTQSAGNQFDIIVIADSKNKLNENARACLHDGDSYFSTNKLEAWELKYCIDNNTSRFAWADFNNGKGVIYWMKDEYGNECPYDFKNIQFKRYKVIATSQSNLINLVGTYIATKTSMINFTVDENQFVWRYTFNNNELTDDSIASDSTINWFANGTYDNVILDYVDVGLKLSLNGIVFNGPTCYGNSFGINCYNNTFGNSICNNIFGNNCRDNTFGENCRNNTFGNFFASNIFGIYCQSNTFGNYCHFNIFGNKCYGNTFGNDCIQIIFDKDYVNYVIVENGNSHITLTTSLVTSATNPLQNITISQGVNNSTTRKTITHTTTDDTFKTIYQNSNSKTIDV